ncbi:hypothetical protein [Clostridium sp. AF32-12BH]|uniref:hypothetical protein n=1 Tax=Clostridium sp. AF32-12BH TaxID=2292006 RepID=UPI000E508C17|nr:hypothetical protein [Clostridium sp. AF32-12BH]RHP47056.1 hypothetical protein DWZ40_09140 [Clostridium sp. AF32-12BH]
MSKLDTQNINVLNYNENEVFVDSSKEHYKFNASRDGKTPSVVPMTLNELQYIASNTDVIVTGWLTFDEDVKEEVFKELRIANWKDILSNSDIEEILLNPTLDGLQKIVDIENQTYFDRVRIAMFKLNSEGIDVSNKVVRIVNQRYDELRKRQRHSSIVLTKKDTQNYATPDEVKELSAQNASLQAQIEEMRKMMEQMMTSQNSNAAPTSESEPATTTTRKTGRPKKTV